MMHLGEEHLLARPRKTPPTLHLTLQRPQLTVGKLPRMRPLQRLQQRLGLQARVQRQLLKHPRPDLHKRIHARRPVVLLAQLTGQLPRRPILPGRLPIHPNFVSRYQQRLLRLQQRHKSPHLAIRHHALNSLCLSPKHARRIPVQLADSNCRHWRILIVAGHYLTTEYDYSYRRGRQSPPEDAHRSCPRRCLRP